MKASYRNYLFFILFLSTNFVKAQCPIFSNIQVINQTCGINGEYYLTIDFDYQNNWNLFRVTTPYTNNIFDYNDLPVTIGPLPGICNEDFNLHIRDYEYDCPIDTLIEYSCCSNLECGLELMSIDYSCNSQNNFLMFVFFNEFGCYTNSTFNIEVDKKDLSQNVVEVFTYGPFAYNPDYNVAEIEVPEPPGCDYLYEVRIVDNLSGNFISEQTNSYCCECVITDFSASIVPNSCDNGLVTVEFEFTGYGYGDNSYTISDGQNQWEFDENSIKQFQLAAYCQQEVTLIARLSSSEACEASFNMPPTCCDCVINSINNSTPVCEGGTFYTFVNIDIDGSCIYSEWTAEVNGNIYPLTESGNDFLVSGIYSEDSITTINFCTEAQNLICYELEVINPCYSPPIPPDSCSITSYIVWQDTVCNNGQAVIRFDFNANNTFGSDGYYVVVDSNSFFFESNEEKTFNYPAYCNDDVTVLIYDAYEPTCNLSDTLSALCCACELDSIFVNTSSCDSGLFNITLAFEGLAGSCQYGSWTVQVSDSTYQATIINNSWAVNGISSLDTIITYEICTFLGECYTTTGLNPCFDTTTVTPLPCQLDSFHVFTLYDCNDGFITNGFTFQGSNFGSNGYVITDGLNTYNFINGEPQEFSSFGNCTGDLIITLYDASDSLCTLTDTINPCCECLIDSFFISAVCDSNELINIYLELFNIEGYCALNGWTVTLGNVTYPMYINNDSVYAALNINSQDTILQLTFCTETGQQHCFTVNKVNPCLTPSNLSCKMSNADIEIFDQSGITAKIEIENNNNCGINYNVWADNIHHGTFTGFENIIYVPLNIGNIPEIDFKICSIEPNVDCVGKQVKNPFFINHLKDELTEVSLIYNEGHWQIENNPSDFTEFNLYNAIGQLVLQRSLSFGENTFTYQPSSTGIYFAFLKTKNCNKTVAVFVK